MTRLSCAFLLLLVASGARAEGPQPAAQGWWSGQPHVELLYRGTSRLGTRLVLQGVNPAASRAYLVGGTGCCNARTGRCGDAGFRMDVVDYARDRLADHWQGHETACPILGRPPDPAAFRWTRELHGFGAGHDRYAMSPDGKHAIYLACPPGPSNRLVLVDGAGKNPRVIAAEPSARDIVFSPDGRYLAWTTASFIPEYPHGEGPAGPRVPAELNVVRIDALSGKTETVPARLAKPEGFHSLDPPVWSEDGSEIRVVAASDTERCLLSVDPAKPDQPRKGKCQPLDAREPLLPAPAAKEPARPLVVIDGEGAISAYDPKTGRRATVKSPNGFYGPYPPLWLDERRVLALHQTANTAYCDAVEYELIAFDVAAALSQ